jgi:exo-1,4-beta-D-glucosaminidase
MNKPYCSSPVLTCAHWFVACGIFCLRIAVAQNNPDVFTLSVGWHIQSAAQTKNSGKEISATTFDAAGWNSATVPTTVLATLVKNGVYKDIFVGKNLEAIPTTQFTNAWWYRTEFEISDSQAKGNADLICEGINYRANLWLNGQSIATADQTFGAYRIFTFNVSGRLKTGKNALAIQVLPPQPGDFTMGFVDWNPKPPDRNMGLFRPVKLHFYNTVAIDNVFVESRIDHETWSKAGLTIDADLVNRSDREIKTTLKGELERAAFSEQITLKAGETRSVTLTPEQHPELTLDQPRLWWPWELGEPNLYTLKLTAQVGNDVADRAETRFGIREVADYLTKEGYRGYLVNGKRILIRGGGWADDMLLDENKQKLEAQVQYTKAMNLNTIRMEGIWGGSQRLFDLADEYGLLLMVGWSCQWEWANHLGKKCDNFGGFKSPEDLVLATNYLHDQVFWLRNHPSIFVWVLGSDMLPRPELETRYDALLRIIDSTRPTLKSCSSKTSKVSGPTAVKMNGPYDYVTPNYWYLDRKNGGAFGFNTETGPGPQPPRLASLERMLPAAQLWPINSVWNYHCARGEFKNLDRYLRAFNSRYGPAKSVEDFAFRSQAANYEAIRPMYEAFAANLPATTGIIQWMLNGAWPKLYWQLYDYYLMPGGAFFGTKKGAAPLSIVYNYGDRGIYLVNQLDRAQPELNAIITAYDLNSRVILQTNLITECPVYGSIKVFDSSMLAPGTPVFFLDLALRDAEGKELASNFYWLSTKPDVLDEEKTEWYVTPNKSFADFTALEHLPQAKVHAETSYGADGKDVVVTLSNSSDQLAFFVEMSLVSEKSQQILLPVLWNDNYVSLAPGARKTYRAHLPALPGRDKPDLRLRGWNVNFEKVAAGS